MKTLSFQVLNQIFVTGMLLLVIAIPSVMVIPSVSMARPAPSGFADLAEQLMPAVVNISTSQTVERSRSGPGGGQPPLNDFFREFFNQQPGGSPQRRKVSSLGSGFVIDPSGIIITNNHVVEEADEIIVNFSDGTKYDATVLGRDPKTDIAVLQVKTKRKLPYVPMGDSAAARVGDWVVAIGNPFGLGGSLSAGVISAINRDISTGPYDSFIQTDAAINRGNSGGPLFNMRGEVIGVNSAIISPSGGSVGIGFSIPSNLATSVIGQLRKYGETRRGWLGLRIQEVTNELADNFGLNKARGALVSETSLDGPAAQGGVRVGDIIVKFDGKAVPHHRDLPRIVAETQINKKVDVEVIRRSRVKKLTIVTGRLQEQQASAAPQQEQQKQTPQQQGGEQFAGLLLSDIDDRARQRFEIPAKVQGVLVVHVDNDSAAYEVGIRRGDVLSEINRMQVSSAIAAVSALKAARKNGSNSVLVLRSSRGNLRFISVPLTD